jgi:rhodanese-related sulfurtransferase
MNLITAIYQLNPTIVTIRGDVAYDANDNVVAYDRAAAQALVAANQYKDQRAVAYPSIADQLDTLYHGGYDAWKATITAVKEEFPKP